MEGQRDSLQIENDKLQDIMNKMRMVQVEAE